MYRPVKSLSDTVAVPQLVFSKLTQPGGDDARFRVALYVLSTGGATAEQTARALHLPKAKVDAALSYWDGAGLIEREAPVEVPVAQPQRRRVMSSREVVQAGQADPTLGFLLEELQRIFGTVIGENDTSILVGLYAIDGFAPDLILLAASETVSNGSKRARYVEKILLSWRESGIHDCTAADKYLKLQHERAQKEEELARRMNFATSKPFTFAERKKIALWFEEYQYDFEMIEAARMTSGDKANDVNYLAGILKKWNAKGYKTPREVHAGGESYNMRPGKNTAAAPADDILMNAAEYVPLQKRSKS